MRLVWDLGENALASIAEAEIETKLAIRDLHLSITCHSTFGKGFIKSCRVSPDAFIQLALQLAFHRDQGRFGLTYESSMTRLFRFGRTETIRSCSSASNEFVLSMDSKSMSNENRRTLLTAAAEVHSVGCTGRPDEMCMCVGCVRVCLGGAGVRMWNNHQKLTVWQYFSFYLGV